MIKVGRALSIGGVTIALALVSAGCSGNVIGADGPQPGLAAQVEDSEISISDLESATDAVCTLQAADVSVPGTSRSFAQSQILQAWVFALVNEEFAADEEIEVTPADPGLESAPGWDEVDDDDRDALAAYADAFVLSQAVQQSAGEEVPDPADYDITINPRFDIKLEGAQFVPAGDQLSVPVSDEAASDDAEPPTDEVLQSLPDHELCGNRPDPQQAPPVPMG